MLLSRKTLGPAPRFAAQEGIGFADAGVDDGLVEAIDPAQSEQTATTSRRALSTNRLRHAGRERTATTAWEPEAART